jgi:methylthioribose-1-phosphate isomerase
MESALEARPREPARILSRLRETADEIAQEVIETDLTLARAGQEVIGEGARILTHCNSGPLAALRYGTAVGVFIEAHRLGNNIHVWVDETRPLLQGARLTTWELARAGVPYTLICDNMAGQVMKEGRIDLVMTGADRIAANGDSANKIGTYALAVLAHAHGIPFYIAAPGSTVDLSCPAEPDIVIEERDADEVRRCSGRLIAPADAPVYNPAFDVTPARYLDGIVTDRGVLRPPYSESLQVFAP